MDKNQGYEIIKAVILENGRGFVLGLQGGRSSAAICGNTGGRP